MSWTTRKSGTVQSGVMLAALLVTPGAVADPLYSKNLAPLVGLFGVPVMRDAGTLERGNFALSVNGSIANNYTGDDNAREASTFDVETQRAGLQFRLGLGGAWEIEAEVPWLRHDGGKLDKTIEDWHDLWNLPDGDRDQAPRDQVNVFYYASPVAIELDEGVSGWGDASVALVRELWRGEDRVISARAGVKLGTGDEDDLLGSGNEDYYLSVNFTGAQAGDLPLLWHGQFGYLRAGSTDLLGDLQEQDLWFAGLGFEWRGWQSVHLKLQIDSQAAVVDSAITQTGDASVQLTAGGTWLFAPGWEMDLSFSEDIAVDTAPDFVLQFGLRYRSR